MYEGLEPGHYRIRLKSVWLTRNDKTIISYLSVFYEKGRKYFQINEQDPYYVKQEYEDEELRRFEIIDEVKEKISVHNQRILITFQDNKGYKVELETTHIQGFNKILNRFKQLDKAVNLEGPRIVKS